MRKLVAVVLLLLAAVGYLATPFISAFQIRQAIRAGDAALLETLVEWPHVRASLKASLAEREREKKALAGDQPRPSLWQRIKAAAMPGSLTDGLIDRYVTATGVIQMHQARATWKSLTKRDAGSTVQTLSADALDAADAADRPAIERFVRFWQRIKRAEFKSLQQVELEIADRNVPERRYVGTMEFRGFGWKLTRLDVVGIGF
jgi:hypothetical protein